MPVPTMDDEYDEYFAHPKRSYTSWILIAVHYETRTPPRIERKTLITTIMTARIDPFNNRLGQHEKTGIGITYIICSIYNKLPTVICFLR